jgi:hypothetical protein
MEALVHFAVGRFRALLALTVVDYAVRREFLRLVLSGFWALVPDGHWMLRGFEVDGPATAWHSFLQTTYANLFWFHRLIDSLETGRGNLEAGIALGVLLVLTLVDYRNNDWSVG